MMMFIYHIRYIECSSLYLDGLLQGLDVLALRNPFWRFTLKPVTEDLQENVHLRILDLTTHSSIDVLVPEWQLLLSSYKTLVLLRATQKSLMRMLLTEYDCSLLCVDEHTFQLRSLIEVTLNKQRYLSPFLERVKNPEPALEQIAFTSVERTVLALIKQGMSGVEISKALYRSEKTVSTHKRNIMTKLGVSSDLELNQTIRTANVVR